MRVEVDLLNASDESDIPTAKDFQYWAECALSHLENNEQSVVLSIRLIDEKESAELNNQYRQKQGPTNILSFPYLSPFPEAGNFLGDLAICSTLVRKEALEQAKQLTDHWTHLLVHGVLHLKGFDHEEDDDALVMESMEQTILAKLGIEDPYK